MQHRQEDGALDGKPKSPAADPLREHVGDATLPPQALEDQGGPRQPVAGAQLLAGEDRRVDEAGAGKPDALASERCRRRERNGWRHAGYPWVQG